MLHPFLFKRLRINIDTFINTNQSKIMKKNLFLNRVEDYYALYSKVLRVMRLTLLLILLSFFQVIAENTYSQNTKLSISLTDAKIKDVLNEIESNSDFYFLYNSKLVDVDKKVSVSVNNQKVEEILDVVFRGQNVGYKVIDRQIIIQPKDVETSPSVFQQSKAVKGKVTGEDGEPIPGATVIAKGTTGGTITDMDGNYSLELGENVTTLIFSFVGMATQEIVVNNQSVINVTLSSETIGLEEVVAVGYGVQRKVTATGSVVSSKGEELKKSPSTNLTNNLVGRMPGLTAVTRSGEPGADGATLRIRGSNTLGDNSPLVVVDGVPNRAMERINASDIESITVLKDASAAIYGAQAANGVILVTTKRGSLGKPKVTINMNQGFNQPTRIPEMANAAQYASMLNEINYYKDPSLGRYQKYSEEDIQLFSDGTDPWGHPNTDWFDAVFKDWSSQNQQNASISGGTENMRYFISLGAKFEDGYYHNSGTNYKQYDFRTNIDGKVSKHISVAFDVAGREEIRNYPTRSASSIFRMLMRGKPNMPAYWPDGTPGPDIEYGDNPAITTTDATGYDLDKRYILETNLRTVIDIPWVEGLSITANASFDKNFKFHKKFETPWYLYTWDGNAERITTKGKRGLDAPQLSEDMADAQALNGNIYATYETTVQDKHNIKVMAGVERRSGKEDKFNAFRKNYISAAVDQLFAGASDQYMSNSGSASQNAYQSYFGRVNYDLSQKYMVEFVWRYDGSYKFPTSKRFGFFPGVSAGWRMSDENFWQNNLAFINDFKLRGSWGQTGNDRIDEYQYLATYGFQSGRTYVFGSNEEKILNETKIPNPNVTWEIANQANIGFDSYLLDRKLSVSADYFINKRTQILIKRNASVPSSTGLVLPPENIGKVSNRGFEAVIGYHNQAGDFQYDLSINGSYSKNKIDFWDETPGRPDYQLSTGHPMPSDPNSPDNDLYYQAIGIFKDQAAIDAYPHWDGAQPGDVIFEDIGGPDGVPDGIIDGLDRVRSYKNNFPRFTGGFTANLRYKQFDLSMLVQGAAGAVQYISPESGEIGNYYKEFADNRWTPENTDASYPRSFNRDEEYWRSQRNTFWLRSTDYIRLKNIEIGYSLSKVANQALGIENLRFYVNALNLFTIDKAKIIDPETEAGTSYAPQRVITGGLTLTF